MGVGVNKMAKEHALVRRMNTLEALGAVSNICSDKTGTLTQAKMVAKEIWVLPGKLFQVSGSGFETKGTITEETSPLSSGSSSSLGMVSELPLLSGTKLSLLPSPLFEAVLAGSVCNNAIITFLKSGRNDGEGFGKAKEEGEEPSVIGDPTEVALQVLGEKASLGKPSLLEKGWELIDEFPFDSRIKKMTTVYSLPDDWRAKWDTTFVAFTKVLTRTLLLPDRHICLSSFPLFFLFLSHPSLLGRDSVLSGAPERVLDCCHKVFIGNEVAELSQEKRNQIDSQNAEMACHGLV
jgi:magnesium-transporting ATPase (P-type)